MTWQNIYRTAFVAVVWAFMVSGAQAVTIDTVTVGYPGNAPDDTGFGSVGYEYRIARYEVTAAQYAEFLNAVAADDTYGLYDLNMLSTEGAWILRSGTPGSYTYSVITGFENRPVNFVSWADAARFANWMHNGQPSGAQDLTTTEDGSYLLNGAVTQDELAAVVRNPQATWVIPTEDEWYKAAFYDGPNDTYYDYPTASDNPPSNLLTEPDPGNNANFTHGSPTLGNPLYRTEVGEFENSASPFGTFDQAGNVWEWNEALYRNNRRGVRGGSYTSLAVQLKSDYSLSVNPANAYKDAGFRLVLLDNHEVPEPASLALLAVGGLLGLRRGRSR